MKPNDYIYIYIIIVYPIARHIIMWHRESWANGFIRCKATSSASLIFKSRIVEFRMRDTGHERSQHETRTNPLRTILQRGEFFFSKLNRQRKIHNALAGNIARLTAVIYSFDSAENGHREIGIKDETSRRSADVSHGRRDGFNSRA